MTTVLVVEDHQDIRDLLADTLLDAGYDVVQAEDGGAGVELACACLPDVILLDVMMPVLDGFQVLKRLKANPHTRSIPVIMVSAKGQEQEIYSAMAAGAQAYIVKPWEPDEVEAKVQEARQQYPRSRAGR